MGLHVAYKNLENVEFIAVADPDDAGRKKAVEETGAIRDYPDYRDMLAKEELDIVSVCPRWIPEHLEMVPDCLEAGCHIYCEKPMTATLRRRGCHRQRRQREGVEDCHRASGRIFAGNTGA